MDPHCGAVLQKKTDRRARKIHIEVDRSSHHEEQYKEVCLVVRSMVLGPRQFRRLSLSGKARLCGRPSDPEGWVMGVASWPIFGSDILGLIQKFPLAFHI